MKFVTWISKHCDYHEYCRSVDFLLSSWTVNHYSIVTGRLINEVVATIIQRKIRSTRNHIHCNLFLAWIFNTIFKCLLFVQGKSEHIFVTIELWREQLGSFIGRMHNYHFGSLRVNNSDVLGNVKKGLTRQNEIE